MGLGIGRETGLGHEGHIAMERMEVRRDRVRFARRIYIAFGQCRYLCSLRFDRRWAALAVLSPRTR